MIGSLQDYYNQAYARHQLDLDERESLSKIAPLWIDTKPNMKVLDLGCGAGSVGAELVKRGHTAFGLDIMEDAVKRANEKGVVAQVFDLDQSQRLPFEDGSFDCVMALDVLEHLFDPVKVLREARRVMRDDGYAIVVLPTHFDIRQRLRILMGKGIVLYEHSVYWPELRAWHYYHIRFFTVPEAARCVGIAGFKVEARIYRALYTADLGRLFDRLFRRRLIWPLAFRFPSLFANAVIFRLRKA